MSGRRVCAAAAVLVFAAVCAAAEKPLTSDDVLRKSAAVYSAMKTYCEESILISGTAASVVPSRSFTVLAFKRPSTYIARVSVGDSAMGMVTYQNAGELTLYNDMGELAAKLDEERSRSQTIKQSFEEFLERASFADGFRFSKDPLAWVKGKVKERGALETSTVDGKTVYVIPVTAVQTGAQYGSISGAPAEIRMRIETKSRVFFDTETFRIVGYDSIVTTFFDEPPMSSAPPIAPTVSQGSMRVFRSFVDETPRDEAGKSFKTDVFSWKPSEGLKMPPRPAATEPEDKPFACTAIENGRKLTSADVLRRVVAAYGDVKIYYEEGYEAMLLGGVEFGPQAERYTLAVRRPDAFKFESGDPVTQTLFHKGAETTRIMLAQGEYGNRHEDMDAFLAKDTMPADILRFGSKGEEYIQANIASFDPLREAKIDGRPVFVVTLTKQPYVHTIFIEKSTCHILRSDMQYNEGEFPGAVQSRRPANMLFGELPRDATGAQIDAFAVTIPGNLREVQSQSAPEAK